jgi:hypothetical protein
MDRGQAAGTLAPRSDDLEAQRPALASNWTLAGSLAWSRSPTIDSVLGARRMLQFGRLGEPYLGSLWPKKQVHQKIRQLPLAFNASNVNGNCKKGVELILAAYSP